VLGSGGGTNVSTYSRAALDFRCELWSNHAPNSGSKECSIVHFSIVSRIHDRVHYRYRSQSKECSTLNIGWGCARTALSAGTAQNFLGYLLVFLYLF
jgi:hypothetical protein